MDKLTCSFFFIVLNSECPPREVSANMPEEFCHHWYLLDNPPSGKFLLSHTEGLITINLLFSNLIHVVTTALWSGYDLQKLVTFDFLFLKYGTMIGKFSNCKVRVQNVFLLQSLCLVTRTFARSCSKKANSH